VDDHPPRVAPRHGQPGRCRPGATRAQGELVLATEPASTVRDDQAWLVAHSAIIARTGI